MRLREHHVTAQEEAGAADGLDRDHGKVVLVLGHCHAALRQPTLQPAKHLRQARAAHGLQHVVHGVEPVRLHGAGLVRCQNTSSGPSGIQRRMSASSTPSSPGITTSGAAHDRQGHRSRRRSCGSLTRAADGAARIAIFLTISGCSMEDTLTLHVTEAVSGSYPLPRSWSS